MTQVATRNQGQALPVSPPSSKPIIINELINSDPILSQYFKSHTSPDNYWRFAHELMLDGLRYRSMAQSNTKICSCNIANQQPVVPSPRAVDPVYQFVPQSKSIENAKPVSQQKNKHYNVAYVKHNRFLSPKQRKQLVTPKVTQMIPTKSTPQIIYGKPRVKIDGQFGCPYHQNQEDCLRSIPYGGPCEPNKTPHELKNTQYEVHFRQQNSPNKNHSTKKTEIPIMNEQSRMKQLSRYKSTPNLNMDIQGDTRDFNKTKKNAKVSNGESRTKLKRQTSKQRMLRNQQELGQTIYVDRIFEVQSRMPGKMRVVKSPKNKILKSTQYYENSQQQDEQDYLTANINVKQIRQPVKSSRQVESKIKFMIERDKKNKAMQKNMKKQQERIKHLQQMIMKNEKQPKKQKKTVKITAEDILSLQSSHSSQMSMMDSQIIKKYKKNTKRMNEIQGSAAYFGNGEKHRIDHSEQFSDCSCSKTFQQQSDENDDIVPLGESSLSDFRA